MACAAGFFGKLPLFHQIMAAGALGGGLLRVVAADTAVIRHHLVHRLIERDSVALLVSLQRVAFPARLESVVMAGTAAPRDLLVIDVGERYGCELAELEIRLRRAQQHEIGLIALEARRVLDPLDLELAFPVMTAGALLGTVGFALDLRGELAVASDTRLVRRHLEGRPVLLASLRGGNRGRSSPCLLRRRASSPPRRRHGDRLRICPWPLRRDGSEASCRNRTAAATIRRWAAAMAVAAGDRPGLRAFVGDLLVTADAVLVIEIHGLLFAGVHQGFVRGGQVAVILNDVAEGAVLFALRHRIRVQIMRELDRRSIQLSEKCHLGKRDHIRSGDRYRRPHSCRNRSKDKQQMDTTPSRAIGIDWPVRILLLCSAALMCRLIPSTPRVSPSSPSGCR